MASLLRDVLREKVRLASVHMHRMSNALPLLPTNPDEDTKKISTSTEPLEPEKLDSEVIVEEEQPPSNHLKREGVRRHYTVALQDKLDGYVHSPRDSSTNRNTSGSSDTELCFERNEVKPPMNQNSVPLHSGYVSPALSFVLVSE